MDVCCPTFNLDEITEFFKAEGINVDSAVEFHEKLVTRYRPLEGVVEGPQLYVERDDWIPVKKT